MDCLISIITITYNAEKEIGRTMKSLKEQSFQDFEHIIIDGASKDNTLQVANDLKTDNCKINSEPDKGLYDAMNKGLAAAKGKYVLFLNAGDVFASSDTLASYANATTLKNSDCADIIFGDTDIVDDKGNFLRHRHLSAPKRLTKRSFSRGMLVCHQAFMVRRALAPMYNLHYRFSADYDWTINCIERSNVTRNVNLNKVAILYLDAGTTEKNKRASLKERFYVMREHYGLPLTLWQHATFIPRAIWRKFKVGYI